MKVYLSSTYSDLREHRAAVDRTLRRMGHDVIGMEQYVAEGARPLARCLDDVRGCDAYVVMVAWRYGYVPDGQSSPGGFSMTELEYRCAAESKKSVLAFLLDPEAPWPASQVDALGPEHNAALSLARFRAELGAQRLVGIFRSPDDLASQVAAAVAVRSVSGQILQRVLDETAETAAMASFASGAALVDTTVQDIKAQVAGLGDQRSLFIDLGDGRRWWATRLLLLANLLVTLTGVRRLVFRQDAAAPSSGLVGTASPTAVVEGLTATFPELAGFLTSVRSDLGATRDVDREIDRQLGWWANFVASNYGGREGAHAIGVRPLLLRDWLGERLVTGSVRCEADELTMLQVEQIVQSFVPYVPLEAVGPEGTVIRLVDRDAFALGLAREWVRAGLPRTPVR